MKPHVLLIGGSGQLGSEIRRQAETRWRVTAPPRAAVDLARPAALAEAVRAVRPDIVVNAGAFHVVDLCESRLEEALTVNAVAVAVLARTCEAVGARLVTVSTDYVFDGAQAEPYRESDPTNPLQAYGLSKAAGEEAALQLHPAGAFVIRSCGLYGHAPSRQKGGNFVLDRLRDARLQEVVEVGCDLVCTPTSAADLARATIALLESEAPAGLYHLTNAGSCDWATFARAVFRHAGCGARIAPVDRRGRYGPARRPPYTILDGGKAAAFGVVLRPWQEALGDYMRGLLA